MTWTKIRSFLAAVFTLVLIFVVLSAITAKAGWQIPGLIHAAKYLGFTE